MNYEYRGDAAECLIPGSPKKGKPNLQSSPISCKYSYRGSFQATDVTSLTVELGADVLEAHCCALFPLPHGPQT